MLELEDETDLIQFGQIDFIEFLKLNLGGQFASGWRDNLLKNPDGRYKFGSMHLKVDQNK